MRQAEIRQQLEQMKSENRLLPAPATLPPHLIQQQREKELRQANRIAKKSSRSSMSSSSFKRDSKPKHITIVEPNQSSGSSGEVASHSSNDMMDQLTEAAGAANISDPVMRAHAIARQMSEQSNFADLFPNTPFTDGVDPVLTQQILETLNNSSNNNLPDCDPANFEWSLSEFNFARQLSSDDTAKLRALQFPLNLARELSVEDRRHVYTTQESLAFPEDPNFGMSFHDQLLAFQEARNNDAITEVSSSVGEPKSILNHDSQSTMDYEGSTPKEASVCKKESIQSEPSSSSRRLLPQPKQELQQNHHQQNQPQQNYSPNNNNSNSHAHQQQQQQNCEQNGYVHVDVGVPIEMTASRSSSGGGSTDNDNSAALSTIMLPGPNGSGLREFVTPSKDLTSLSLEQLTRIVRDDSRAVNPTFWLYESGRDWFNCDWSMEKLRGTPTQDPLRLFDRYIVPSQSHDSPMLATNALDSYLPSLVSQRTEALIQKVVKSAALLSKIQSTRTIITDKNLELVDVWRRMLSGFELNAVHMINFIKSLPGFTHVDLHDRILLTSNAMMPLLFAQLSLDFDPDTETVNFFSMSRETAELVIEHYGTPDKLFNLEVSKQTTL